MDDDILNNEYDIEEPDGVIDEIEIGKSNVDKARKNYKQPNL